MTVTTTRTVAVLVLAALTSAAASTGASHLKAQARSDDGQLDRFVLLRTSDSAHVYPAGVPAPPLPVTVRLRIAVGEDGRPRLSGMPTVAALDEGVAVPAETVEILKRAAREEVEQWRYLRPLVSNAMLDVTLNYFLPSHAAAARRRLLVRVTPVVPSALATTIRGFGMKGLIQPNGIVSDLVVDGPAEVQEIARAAVAQWRYAVTEGPPVSFLTVMNLASQ